MDKAALLALADRVEALTGPDRMIDAEIAWRTKWRWDGWEIGDLAIEDRTLQVVQDRVEYGCNSIWQNLPAYTASIDSAMTLVPSMWRIIMEVGEMYCQVTFKRGWGAKTQWLGVAGTERSDDEIALAVAAAALRARTAS